MSTNFTQVAVLGLAAAGIWWWMKDDAPAAAVSAPTRVDDCLKMRPNWTKGRCDTTLKQLEDAYKLAKARVDNWQTMRNAYIATGQMAEVARIDAEIVPWQQAVANHANDYFKLTGAQLG